MKDEFYFYDPKHGGCLRQMRKIAPNFYIINGAYGSDEGKTGYWAATAKKKGNELTVDFTMKKKLKHKPIYKAIWKNREIHWEDGNIWKELYA